MNDGKPKGGEARVCGGKSPWVPSGVLGTVCVLVVAVYACTAHSGFLESLSPNAADAYYNLLVQGFRAGQLNVNRAAPAGLAQLADPYDPAANSSYVWTNPSPLFDMSLYRGRLYLYWGITPALLLFWPCAVLTGHYLFHRQAVVIFCALGFLASVGLLCALWRRYFTEVSVWVVAACTLALGLATAVPVVLPQSEVYQVSISCGYMLTMLALGALWRALHEPEQRCRWLVAASTTYGLAVGARPSLLLGAVILLAPVVQARRERRPVWTLLMAATGPILLIGTGLILYNALRFDNPFEFGWRYQLAGYKPDPADQFRLRYLWFNFRVYFLQPEHWSGRFPFVHGIAVPPLPAGHQMVDNPFGVLTNTPLVWLALAAPLAWHGRSAESRSILGGFLAAVALLFGICAMTLCAFFSSCVRYQVEFLPELVLLAVAGILGLESALAGRPAWQRATRWGWALLLAYSVVFNLLAQVERYAESQNNLGNALIQLGRASEAVGPLQQALRIKPDSADAHNNLGNALLQLGRLPEAVAHYQQAVQCRPDFAEAQSNLGSALLQSGGAAQALAPLEEAVRIKPDLSQAQNNLGNALLQLGRLPEAVTHFQQAVRFKPDFAEAQNNLGVVLVRLGRPSEAIIHLEQALRAKPDFVAAHCNLGVALEQTDRRPEAMAQYEQALRLMPDCAEAQDRLAHLRALR